MSSHLARRTAGLTLLALLGLVALTGCGSSTASRPATPGTLGLSTSEQAKVRRCLTAAGVPSAFLTRAPSGVASGGPVGKPTGSPPGGSFGSPRVKAALKACGITLPTVPGASLSPG
jgi:hypothetical protein